MNSGVCHICHKYAHIIIIQAWRKKTTIISSGIQNHRIVHLLIKNSEEADEKTDRNIKNTQKEYLMDKIIVNFIHNNL